MFVKKKIDEETRDNEFLLEQIQDPVVKQRLSHSLKWYTAKAVKNKYGYYFLSGCTIIFPILAEIFLSIPSNWEDGMHILSIIAVGVSAVSASFLTLFDVRRKWGLYRDQAEFMKEKLSLFHARGHAVPKAEQELLEQIEQNMEKTQEKWNEQFHESDVREPAVLKTERKPSEQIEQYMDKTPERRDELFQDDL